MKPDTPVLTDREMLGLIEWPKPEAIAGELPAVDQFDERLLPESFREFAVDIAERMQVPLDYPATVAVCSLAGAVNRRARIQPKEKDTGWIVVPNAWGGLVAPPGYLKSPVIKTVTRPLDQLQAEWRAYYQQAASEYESAKEELELRHAAWRETFKSNSKSGKATPARMNNELSEPTLRRLIVNDSTFESMHLTMSENPAGILVIRDELTGWWSQLDRPGREGERAFFLQAWNGDTGFDLDRIVRGDVHVPACCLSFIGGIQPARLRFYLADAIHDGPSNDGLIQRFQLLVWPDTNPDWKYIDRPPKADVEGQVAQVFRRLVALDPEEPARYRFAQDAQKLFVEWLTELEWKVRSDELHPALSSHLSKFRSLMPTIAVLFELADWASGRGSGDTVSLDHAKQSAEFCEYLESHARRIYSCITTPQRRSAHELAKKNQGSEGWYRWILHQPGRVLEELDRARYTRIGSERGDVAGGFRLADGCVRPGKAARRSAIRPLCSEPEDLGMSGKRWLDWTPTQTPFFRSPRRWNLQNLRNHVL
jgi:hypothetical protein